MAGMKDAPHADDNAMREERAARMNLAVELIPGCPKREWGRATWLSRILLERENVSVGSVSVRKWLDGEMLPRGRNMSAICRLAKIDAGWFDPPPASSPQGSDDGALPEMAVEDLMDELTRLRQFRQRVEADREANSPEQIRLERRELEKERRRLAKEREKIAGARAELDAGKRHVLASRFNQALAKIPDCPIDMRERPDWLSQLLMEREKVGVSASLIRSAMAGKSLPSGEVLEAFCRMAHVDPIWLLHGTTPVGTGMPVGALMATAETSVEEMERIVATLQRTVAERKAASFIKECIERIPGCPKAMGERADWLARLFQVLQGISVSPATVQNWMEGTNLPRGANQQALFHLAQVNTDETADYLLSLSRAKRSARKDGSEAEDQRQSDQPTDVRTRPGTSARRLIGHRIRAALDAIPGRPERGMIKWLVRRLSEDEGVPVSTGTVNSWLAGSKVPVGDELAAFCRFARIDQQWLLSGTGQDPLESRAAWTTDSRKGAIAALRGYLALAAGGAMVTRADDCDLEAVVNNKLFRIQLAEVRDDKLVFRGPCPNVILVSARAVGGHVAFTIHYPHPFLQTQKGEVKVRIEKVPFVPLTNPIDLLKNRGQAQLAS